MKPIFIVTFIVLLSCPSSLLSQVVNCRLTPEKCISGTEAVLRGAGRVYADRQAVKQRLADARAQLEKCGKCSERPQLEQQLKRAAAEDAMSGQMEEDMMTYMGLNSVGVHNFEDFRQYVIKGMQGDEPVDSLTLAVNRASYQLHVHCDLLYDSSRLRYAMPPSEIASSAKQRQQDSLACQNSLDTRALGTIERQDMKKCFVQHDYDPYEINAPPGSKRRDYRLADKAKKDYQQCMLDSDFLNQLCTIDNFMFWEQTELQYPTFHRSPPDRCPVVSPDEYDERSLHSWGMNTWTMKTGYAPYTPPVSQRVTETPSSRAVGGSVFLPANDPYAQKLFNLPHPISTEAAYSLAHSIADEEAKKKAESIAALPPPRFSGLPPSSSSTSRPADSVVTIPANTRVSLIVQIVERIDLPSINAGHEFLAKVVSSVPRGAIEPGSDVYLRGSVEPQPGRGNSNVIWVAMVADYAIVGGKRVSISTLVPQKEYLSTGAALRRGAEIVGGATFISSPSRPLRLTVLIDNK